MKPSTQEEEIDPLMDPRNPDAPIDAFKREMVEPDIRKKSDPASIRGARRSQVGDAVRAAMRTSDPLTQADVSEPHVGLQVHGIEADHLRRRMRTAPTREDWATQALELDRLLMLNGVSDVERDATLREAKAEWEQWETDFQRDMEGIRATRDMHMRGVPPGDGPLAEPMGPTRAALAQSQVDSGAAELHGMLDEVRSEPSEEESFHRELTNLVAYDPELAGKLLKDWTMGMSMPYDERTLTTDPDRPQWSPYSDNPVVHEMLRELMVNYPKQWARLAKGGVVNNPQLAHMFGSHYRRN